MKRWLAGPLMCVIALAGCKSPPSETTGIAAGQLGSPLGTFLRIEGARLEAGKSGDRTLLVDTVNGEPVEPPVAVWIDNLTLPLSVRCRISGYETGQWIGLPHEVARAENMSPPQAAWQFRRFFIATSVQEPQSLATQLRRESAD